MAPTLPEALGRAFPSLFRPKPGTHPWSVPLEVAPPNTDANPVPEGPSTTYFLAPHGDSGIQQSAPSPSAAPTGLTPLPRSTLLFAFTHPPLTGSPPTRFFLTALPDPISFLHTSSARILGQLSPSSHPHSDSADRPAPRWRHQLVHLELEDKPGLAATSSGRIAVSLHWVGDIMRQVEDGRRDLKSATKEFKGVLLHELVHVFQHDGGGTTPGWLIESIADLVRLEAGLDPPHWRKPGQAKRHKGWEESYDVGARFLYWLTKDDNDSANPTDSTEANANGLKHIHSPGSDSIPISGMSIPTHPAPESTATAYSTPTPTPTSTEPISPPPPQTTQYPSGPSAAPPPRAPRPGKPRRQPLPELIRLMDARLDYEKWSEVWWSEMAGGG
ncbi:hypothetical protein EHS25_008850 [Saitozyma podzolica]|uniref:Uncharacterized protein n=1 Tax=Saitozyma podzolica TaxID=1890683 RepID=A0A427YMX8_9TREE|nr:hypothetical protein EHS25_008850 [Saitozyma podzolica]